MARVFVGMSGGVDSSVAAALLLEAGHEVTGITMQLLPEGQLLGECCGTDAVRSARRVCDTLGIPHYTWDFREIFEREVITPFAQEYAAGRTPNPCARCNDRVKFADLLARSLAAGADMIATGHYARIIRDECATPWLASGVDGAKDQSYFLYSLTPQVLEHTLFPLGELAKSEVRQIAARLELPSAERSESQETCFAPAGEHVSVVATRCPEAVVPGEIVDANGAVLGMHRGLAYYTVGQRKGLGIAAPEPLYVVGLDADANRVVVGGSDALSASRVEAHTQLWRLGPGTHRVDAMTRYRMLRSSATAISAGDTLIVEFDEPLSGVAPGQSVVCYDGDLVVGGGTIKCAS
ncbi:MAG: tRNA 2-thiouridine(34) synthase MnmA [Coriobacteriia bacterium]|nr:tRNA 2-thiouridine(34) synthase MnmA [Coriobacteriia bacterium]